MYVYQIQPNKAAAIHAPHYYFMSFELSRRVNTSAEVGLCNQRRLSVSLSVCGQDYAMSTQSIFMEPCRIMDYLLLWGKVLTFELDPSQSG